MSQNIGDINNKTTSNISLFHKLVETEGILDTNDSFCAFCKDDHICALSGFKWCFVNLFLQKRQKLDMHRCQVKWFHFFDFSINFPQRGHNWIDFPLTTSEYLNSISSCQDFP